MVEKDFSDIKFFKVSIHVSERHIRCKKKFKQQRLTLKKSLAIMLRKGDSERWIIQRPRSCVKMETSKQVTNVQRSRNGIAYRIFMMILLKLSNKRAGKL